MTFVTFFFFSQTFFGRHIGVPKTSGAPIWRTNTQFSIIFRILFPNNVVAIMNTSKLKFGKICLFTCSIYSISEFVDIVDASNLTNNNLMTSHQSKFRTLHSTATALLEATKKWAYSIDRGNINAVIFLDPILRL